MIGKTLSHYRILDKLGEGGMGEVYRAEDTTLKRQVALKILPADLAANQDRLERFQREAETLAALDHPNIVTIHTVELAQEVRFLTMQLVEGSELSDLIPTGGMTLERIFEIAIPLADALAAAHEQRVIHRDLKPGNIMVTNEGRVKVLDFGLAKLRPETTPEGVTQLATEPLTERGRIVGTVPYMSPEQLEGRNLDARSDIFSLGVILYEMATGARPFKGDTSVSLISSIIRDTPQEVDALRADIPHHLGRIIRHCLEKEAPRRYQSALDVRNELEDLRGEIQSREAAISSALPAPSGRRTRRTWIALLAVLAVLVVVSFYVGRHRTPRVASKSAGQIASLAVLPLENLANDPEQDYFVDGMTEALLSDLAKIESLRVISRQSVMQYKGSEKPLPKIAKELSVDAIVAGSALLTGDRVRITARLIEATTDRHLWSRSYERSLADVLRLQSEVARAIAGEIRVILTPEDETRLTGARPVDPEAHQLYLKGRFHWNKKTGDGFEKSIEYFHRLLELDPDNAAGHAALAATYADLVSWGRRPADEVLPKAKAAARKALELDPTLSEAHRVLGQVGWIDWTWPVALDQFERAIQLSPGSADALHQHGYLLSFLGRHEQGIEELRDAQLLDPLSTTISVHLGRAYHWARKYDRAIEEYRKVLELSPDDLYAQWALGATLGQIGQYDEAISTFLSRKVASAHINYALGHTYGMAGRRDEAVQVLEALLERSETSFVPPAQIATVYLGLGETDRVFEWTERGYRAHDPFLIGFLADPSSDSIRDDPRFQDLRRRMDFPE